MSKPSWNEQPIYGWAPPKLDRAIRKREGALDWLKHWANLETVKIDVPDGLPNELL